MTPPVLPLFGSLARDGLEIAALNREAPALRFTLPVPANALGIVFHLAGSGTMNASSLSPESIAIGGAETRMVWEDTASCDATWLIVSIDRLRVQLGPFRPGLRAEFRKTLFQGAPLAQVAPFSSYDQALAETLRRPPVTGEAAGFWFHAKLDEILAHHAFPNGKPETEFFCTRQRRVAMERVAKVKSLIDARLDETFDLKELSRAAGCSPHYLCRTFSEHAGMTITRYLRTRRIERAAQLLASGRYNVSEAAIEVGYQSLSHFSKAFQQEKGCRPSRYGSARLGPGERTSKSFPGMCPAQPLKNGLGSPFSIPLPARPGPP